VQLKNL